MGLFSSRGPSRIGWAHQTYAEFLAARYLVQNRLAVPQMMALLIHPNDDDNRLVPQLQETAAWLASLNSEVFREIMKIDPIVLLRSDVTTTHEQDRMALTEQLLDLYKQEKLRADDFNIRKHYKKLAHPKLAEQIRPFIIDNTKDYLVRRAAIDIASACQLTTLADDLADIALDSSQLLTLRVDATHAIAHLDNDDIKAKLKPLVAGEIDDDPEDELKGGALFALWPKHLTTKELFAILTLPKRTNLLGSYRLFLSRDLVQHIQPSDLPFALNWVEK